jgi:sugar O-acyltransferase (sialic acid O-acetyltransferase NeuD family)
MTSRVERVLIIGAGGHAQVVVDIFLCMQRLGGPISPVGYLDDDLGKRGQLLIGVPVLGSIRKIREIAHDALIVAIGDNYVRHQVFQDLLRGGEQLISALHPSAIIGADVIIGKGTVICAGTVINPGARIGNNVILNTGCRVDHHCRIGDDAHIAPGVTLGGEVIVGNGAMVGLGSSILPRQNLGDWCTVGAGAVVHRHVAAHDTVVGIPAISIHGR